MELVVGGATCLRASCVLHVFRFCAGYVLHYDIV